VRIFATLCCLLLAAATFGQDTKPKKEYVPDSDTAVKVAEAVLAPIYGQAKVESQEPFTAKLKDDVWTVSGTLLCASDQNDRRRLSPSCSGILEVLISKKDAHVLDMFPRK
jgi:NTF2 fold immunity protein of polymorphic toxin system component